MKDARAFERSKRLFAPDELHSLHLLPHAVSKFDKTSARTITASSYVENLVVLEVSGPDIPGWTIAIECDADATEHVARALLTGDFE